MSKGKPQSLIAQISQQCRVYRKDTDGMRVSASRLENFINKRDQAISDEIKSIRAELAEQKQLIAAINKYRTREGL